MILLKNIEEIYGQDGLKRLIDNRAAHAKQTYAAALKPATTLKEKLDRLAAQRTKEGYMAEVFGDEDDGFFMAENHCSICVAARTCQTFCHSELSLFRDLLGEDVCVERVEHILEGDRRCLYRISFK